MYTFLICLIFGVRSFNPEQFAEDTIWKTGYSYAFFFLQTIPRYLFLKTVGGIGVNRVLTEETQLHTDIGRSSNILKVNSSVGIMNRRNWKS